MKSYAGFYSKTIAERDYVRCATWRLMPGWGAEIVEVTYVADDLEFLPDVLRRLDELRKNEAADYVSVGHLACPVAPGVEKEDAPIPSSEFDFRICVAQHNMAFEAGAEDAYWGRRQRHPFDVVKDSLIDEPTLTATYRAGYECGLAAKKIQQGSVAQ